eukprot:g7862.t1
MRVVLEAVRQTVSEEDGASQRGDGAGDAAAPPSLLTSLKIPAPYNAKTKTGQRGLGGQLQVELEPNGEQLGKQGLHELQALIGYAADWDDHDKETQLVKVACALIGETMPIVRAASSEGSKTRLLSMFFRTDLGESGAVCLALAYLFEVNRLLRAAGSPLTILVGANNCKLHIQGYSGRYILQPDNQYTLQNSDKKVALTKKEQMAAVRSACIGSVCAEPVAAAHCIEKHYAEQHRQRQPENDEGSAADQHVVENRAGAALLAGQQQEWKEVNRSCLPKSAEANVDDTGDKEEIALENATATHADVDATAFGECSAAEK